MNYLTYSKGLYCIELDALVRINTEMGGKTITRYDIINNCQFNTAKVLLPDSLSYLTTAFKRKLSSGILKN